jgi:hypothetical protein
MISLYYGFGLKNFKQHTFDMELKNIKKSVYIIKASMQIKV